MHHVRISVPENSRPYIHVEGESSVPSSITLFAATGGGWNLIELPDEVIALQPAAQAPRLRELMRRYLDRYQGFCPFFGRVVGFRFVRESESLRFDSNGVFIEQVAGAFERPSAELRIGNKTLQSLFL